MPTRNRLFNSIRIQVPKRNVFDLSHEKKLSCNMGELIPIYLQEVIPADKFRVSSEVFVRLAPMVAPMMHRCNVYVHYFFVPNRLIWTNWEDFITGGASGTNASVHPYMVFSNHDHFIEGNLSDYFGLPDLTGLSPTNAISVNSLPFRAYCQIWNDYYRDPTLDLPYSIPKTDGDDSASIATLCALRYRAWEKDYFTSALTNTQRGGDVVLPGVVDYKNHPLFTYESAPGSTSDNIITNSVSNPSTPGLTGANLIDQIDNLDGYDITINDLRTASRLQEWLEKQARGGSRYLETILSHFGVMNKDSRLQRAEYLGGGKQPIIISEVLNTSDTASAPQGNMSGHGISVGKTNSFKRSFTEHGWVIGILSVLPRTAYQQGIERHWFKANKYDYAWPSMANLGEQPVYYKEIYPAYTGTDNNDTAFGYQSRYAEYKFKQSSVHGAFRSSLYHWHMGRIFGSQPSLNSSFVTSDPTHRIFAVTTSSVDKLYVQIYNNVQAIRALPKYGTPKL